MANPTGTTYLTPNQSYTWADGDVYEIPGTDNVEGTAVGASFSGLGVDNQPHQELLNKANLIRKMQLTDEATIKALQTSLILNSSGGFGTGWIKFGASDVNLGNIILILQWGQVDMTVYTPANIPSDIPITFPIIYPNACWLLNGFFVENGGNISTGMVTFTKRPFQLQNNLFNWASDSGQMVIANKAHTGVTGLGWFAWGY